MAEKIYRVYDIAVLAGVSPATVSRVLNHPELVKPETVQAVRKVMDSVNFSYTVPPKIEERKVVLVSVPSYTNMFYSDVINGIYSSAEVHDLSVLTVQKPITPHSIDFFIQLLVSINCVGLITLDPMTKELFERISAQVPVVQCCEFSEDVGIQYVSINDYASARTAVEYLISRGHSKIGFVNGPMKFKFARERLRGYEEAVRAAGLEVNPEWVLTLADVQYSIGFSAISQMLNSPNLPDSLFCVSDVFASAAISAAKKNGLSVPEDISIVGFDNTEVALMSSPSISTISQPRFQLGYMASEMLHDLILNQGSNYRMRNMILPTELIIRESSK